MKTITAFVGSARPGGHTYGSVREFLDRLEATGDVQTEIVLLADHPLGTCRGCKLCFERGEESCPYKDDRDLLIAKMEASDGVVFASPNYSFQVSALMKLFLDRLGFLFHRPRFHGKVFTSIVAQGIYGGDKIVKYLDFVGTGLGFRVVKGSCSTAFVPMTAKAQAKRDKGLARHARRFHAQLAKPAFRVPSLVELAIFRAARTSIRTELDDTSRDFNYYAAKGWFDSDYYCPTRLGFFKRLAGSMIDSLSASLAKGRG